jgi:TRAP-type mannitol/chloroaromatic compound transport system permease large subunit
VSTILVTVPVILPLMASLGCDGVWFGVFVIQSQNPDIPAVRIYLGTLPFLAADFVLVALLVAFPALALWLPAVLKL